MQQFIPQNVFQIYSQDVATRRTAYSLPISIGASLYCKESLMLRIVRIFMPTTHRRRRRDETVLSRWRRRCEHNSQLAHDDCRRIRSTIWKLAKQTPYRFDYVNLIDIDNFFNNDNIMTSLLKKLSISIKIGVIKRVCCE